MNIDHLWAISAVCLSVTIVVCLVAVTGCKRHALNPLMYFGLLGIMLGCIPRLRLLFELRSFDGVMPPYALLSVHVGITCFLVGYAWRVFVAHRHERRTELRGPGRQRGALAYAKTQFRERR